MGNGANIAETIKGIIAERLEPQGRGKSLRVQVSSRTWAPILWTRLSY